jgi:hypothetical protein
MVEYVYKLYENTIVENGKQKKTTAAKKGDSDTDADSESDDDGERALVKIEDQQGTVLVNDHMMLFFRQMQDNDQITTDKQTVDPDKNAKEFHDRIERMIQDYRQHCISMQMEVVLNKYGNETYHKDKEKIQNELSMRTTIKDPGYTSKYFDVLMWWRVEGTIKFKELSVAANFFGKANT